MYEQTSKKKRQNEETTQLRRYSKTEADLQLLNREFFLISSLPGKALKKCVDIARLVEIQRILGECLLISSLPGTVLRMLVDIM